jgi:hypothetical protein
LVIGAAINLLALIICFANIQKHQILKIYLSFYIGIVVRFADAYLFPISILPSMQGSRLLNCHASSKPGTLSLT